MQEQRLLYRLALGLPNQEDLVEILARQATITPDDVRAVSIGLSPWFHPEAEGDHYTR
jgi:hypothetical protein